MMSPARFSLFLTLGLLTACASAPNDSSEESSSASSELTTSPSPDDPSTDTGSTKTGSVTKRKLPPTAQQEHAAYSLIPQEALIPTDPSPWNAPKPK